MLVSGWNQNRSEVRYGHNTNTKTKNNKTTKNNKMCTQYT